MKRSPCHSCYLAADDKNGPECLVCEKRTAYVASLEGRSGPVPMEMTDMAGRDLEKTRRDDQFLRDNQDMPPAEIAGVLGRSLASIYVRRSVLGLTKDKRRAMIKARDELRKKIEAGHPSFIDAEGIAGDSLQDTAPSVKLDAPMAELVPANDLMLVNVHGLEDLYERLKRSAKENFRTPELQALWFIHRALQAEDGARDQRRAPGTAT